MKEKTALTQLIEKVDNDKDYSLPLKNHFVNLISELLELEKKQIIDFHIKVMRQGLINEGDRKWDDAYMPKIRETAETYFTDTYEQPK